MINENEFELIFNIQPNNQIFFNDLSLIVPDDFEKENFSDIYNMFKKIKGEPYSINKVNKILEKIEIITINDQYLSIKASVDEEVIDDKLNLIFKIDEKKKYYLKKINILGNNVTQENVIRNQFEIDEGDPFNEIIKNKTINNIKNLNFLENVFI